MSAVTRLQGELHIDHAQGVITFHASGVRSSEGTRVAAGDVLKLSSLPAPIPAVSDPDTVLLGQLSVTVHQATVSWSAPPGPAPDVNMAALLTIADAEGNIKDIPLDYETSWEDQGFIVFKAYSADGAVYMFRLSKDDAHEALGIQEGASRP